MNRIDYLMLSSIFDHEHTRTMERSVLLNAKTLLRSGQYSVQQVSDLLAFPNPSFFGKYFREHVGCTPREYQMQGCL